MASFEYDFHGCHKLQLPKERYTGKGLTGLVNLGNKCFMNSILQCLVHSLKLSDYFLSGQFREEDPENLYRRREEYYVVMSYTTLVHSMFEQNQLLKPKSFVENISKFVRKYFSCQQQDSHECLMYIFDILHRALKYEIDVEIRGEVKNTRDALMKQSLEQWTGFFKDNYSFIVEQFGGMLMNEVSCVNCKKPEQRIFEPFTCLSVNLGKHDTTLDACLADFFKRDELVTTWTCEACDMAGCRKSCSAWSLPNYLVIHLKRFTNDGRKIRSFVEFPMDDLVLSSYVTSQKGDPNNYVYSLYAVNCHSGDVGGGHYWSHCKNLDGKWYTFNDGDVSKAPSSQVKAHIVTNDAYILFYYRKFIEV